MSTLPRLIALDTSHWAGLVTDLVSGSNERRRAASRFIPKLLEQGWVPLLSWHHLEELLLHNDEDLVDARLRYLRSIPRLAWIRPSLPGAGPGSIVDLLRPEVAVALRSGEAAPLRVRDAARKDSIILSDGIEAVPESLDDWRMLRGHLEHRQHRARGNASITKWRAADIDNLPLSQLLGRPFQSLEEVMPKLQRQRRSLEDEIITRGDKRIEDPASMAAEFMHEVMREGVTAQGNPGVDPVFQSLINAGLDPEDIDPSATFGQTMDLMVFRKRLRVAAEGLDVPWADVKRGVRRDQLPITIVEDAMRRHAQDQPERKGSDLNDTHLLCLAVYADLTLVDKRTLENVRRLRTKDAVARQLLGRTERAADYSSILGLISTAVSLRNAPPTDEPA